VILTVLLPVFLKRLKKTSLLNSNLKII